MTLMKAERTILSERRSCSMWTEMAASCVCQAKKNAGCLFPHHETCGLLRIPLAIGGSSDGFDCAAIH